MADFPTITNRSLSASFARGLPKYFSKEEVLAVIYNHPHGNLSPAERRKNYLKRFLCWFLWNTGARITEARNVVVSDIEPWAGVVHLETLKKKKGGKFIRTLPKHFKFFQEVQAYILINNIQSRNEKLFKMSDRTARRWITEVCHGAGIDDERAHAHTFRHSFAVNCVRDGTHIVVLRKWLGHSDITKTMVYTEIAAADTRRDMDRVRFE